MIEIKTTNKVAVRRLLKKERKKHAPIKKKLSYWRTSQVYAMSFRRHFYYYTCTYSITNIIVLFHIIRSIPDEKEQLEECKIKKTLAVAIVCVPTRGERKNKLGAKKMGGKKLPPLPPPKKTKVFA